MNTLWRKIDVFKFKPTLLKAIEKETELVSQIKLLSQTRISQIYTKGKHLGLMCNVCKLPYYLMTTQRVLLINEKLGC